VRTKYPFRSLVTTAALAGVLGCASSAPVTITQLAPIDLGGQGSAPITFTRLIIRVPSGTDIGAHHDGLLKLSKFRHTWLSDITVGSDEFKIVASEHLKSRGYNVLGGDNLLFGPDESAKAEYQLGGTVTSIDYNSYGALAGNYSDSSLAIEWQLYDAVQERVMYAAKTSGYGKQAGIGSACVQSAFRSALDNLLADSKFVADVRKSPLDNWDHEPELLAPIVIATSQADQAATLPADLDVILRSVLVIRAGAAVGSGVVISKDGWAITAAHVVAGLDEVVVHAQSGLELTASVVRVDHQQDVALIRLPGRGHPCLALATEAVIGVGSDLLAVGSPTGEELAFSVTKGIVSGFREQEGTQYIQTDAALNPGNSGGPLLSPDGKVIGIVSWKISAPGFEGLAFGVPADALMSRLGIQWE
jgi:serine protease Do